MKPNWTIKKKAEFLLAEKRSYPMREKIKKFLKSRQILFFFFTQKGIKRFNESHFKSRKVKRRATSIENRKFVIVVVKSALGIVKKMFSVGLLIGKRPFQDGAMSG